ncbi:TetR/AcrR family transcriptional regulator [Nocardia fusca]|uniref:TetR/AcrR family transcriptional regulator n=1 Tax=Nocardia fusca TaxID=941183 RepID=A0ABV3FB12_9NOCA
MAGRPREFDRDVALTRAQALFWERGYEGVSLTDLVAATGLASARLYAAFGSKEQLFREAVVRYEREEGGFADRALASEPDVRRALERMFHEAIDVYTRPSPRGCLVVTAATNCTEKHHTIQAWLAEHRRSRTESIIGRVRRAVRERQLSANTDVEALGQALSIFLNGLSVQSRDGVPPEQLHASIAVMLSGALPDSTPCR